MTPSQASSGHRPITRAQRRPSQAICIFVGIERDEPTAYDRQALTHKEDRREEQFRQSNTSAQPCSGLVERQDNWRYLVVSDPSCFRVLAQDDRNTEGGHLPNHGDRRLELGWQSNLAERLTKLKRGTSPVAHVDQNVENSQELLS